MVYSEQNFLSVDIKKKDISVFFKIHVAYLMTGGCNCTHFYKPDDRRTDIHIHVIQ